MNRKLVERIIIQSIYDYINNVCRNHTARRNLIDNMIKYINKLPNDQKRCVIEILREIVDVFEYNR